MEDYDFRMVLTAGGDPTPDAMPQSQHLTDVQSYDDLIAELCNPPDILWEILDDFSSLDDVMNYNHPQIESKELTSPSSSGGITQTPSSGDFDFIRSPGSYQISHMSPHSLMESPQACFAGRDKLTPDQLNISPLTRNGFAPGTPGMVPSSEPNFNFNSPPGFHAPYMSPNSLMGSPQVCSAGSSQFTPHQINSSPYTRERVACEALGMVPPSNVNPPPSQTIRASRKRPRILKNIPPGMKASGMTAYVFSHTLPMSQPLGHWLINTPIVTQTAMAQSQQARAVSRMSHALWIPIRAEQTSCRPTPASRSRRRVVTRPPRLRMVFQNVCEEGRPQASFDPATSTAKDVEKAAARSSVKCWAGGKQQCFGLVACFSVSLFS
jgi:hypothetical protein